MICHKLNIKAKKNAKIVDCFRKIVYICTANVCIIYNKVSTLNS